MVPAKFAGRHKGAAEIAAQGANFAGPDPANNSTLPKTNRAFTGKF
jgi:hypothetical protein